MEKLNKVIIGLEHCRDKDCGCEGCPYFEYDGCESRLHRDNVEMLKRLSRQLKYARAERDAERAKMARLIGEAEARWIGGASDGDIQV